MKVNHNLPRDYNFRDPLDKAIPDPRVRPRKAGDPGGAMPSSVRTFGGTPGVMMSADEILPGLWMGDFGSRRDAQNIDLIINLAQPSEDERGMHWEIADGPLPDMGIMQQFVDIVTQALCEGETVLIHCNAGVNRSGLLTALVVREMENLTGIEALELLRSRRPRGPFPNIVCNPAFEAYVKALDRPREVLDGNTVAAHPESNLPELLLAA